MYSKHSFAYSILVRCLVLGLALFVADVQAHAQIAFVSDRDRNEEIYVMNADGSNLRNLTRNPAIDSFPAWSPDGRRIAFLSRRDGNDEIYVMDAKGRNTRNLTKNPSVDQLPSWSPSGEHIAFSTDRDGNLEIYVMERMAAILGT